MCPFSPNSSQIGLRLSRMVVGGIGHFRTIPTAHHTAEGQLPTVFLPSPMNAPSSPSDDPSFSHAHQPNKVPPLNPSSFPFGHALLLRPFFPSALPSQGPHLPFAFFFSLLSLQIKMCHWQYSPMPLFGTISVPFILHLPFP